MDTLAAFFIQAAVSPGRRRALRSVVAAHLAILAGAVWVAARTPGPNGPSLLGSILLLLGILEGAALLGWRLTQLPKSQAMEFLLVTPLFPAGVFLAEAAVGLGRLALVTFAGLPVLLIVTAEGLLDPLDVAPLLLMPFTWGALTGLGLIVWAYEPLIVRRWGERLMLGLVVAYLVVGVLAGEHLRHLLSWISPGVEQWSVFGFAAFERYNPFQVLSYWQLKKPGVAWPRMAVVEGMALLVSEVLLLRAACRLKAHFHERHYQPAVLRKGSRRGRIGDSPLAWWAVKRVTQYSGRINLWLAGGFGVLYAVYTVAGNAWPDWLGRRVFEMIDGMGGASMLATTLMVLAAVPAAFQYGLWDPSAEDRCRRLELLLLTHLQAQDYWQAAAAAAWRRGRGYFAVAGLLGLAAFSAGQMTFTQMLAGLAAGVLLWGLYFTLGFRAFACGLQANGLGTVLTLGLPLLAFGCYRLGQPAWAALVPPGSIYQAGTAGMTRLWFTGALAVGLGTLALARLALSQCEEQLRNWYTLYHGSRIIE